MFGHESLPSCVYKYGCKPPHENMAACEDQFSRAHAYRKKLVEIERARREAVAAKLREMAPELAALQAAAEQASARVDSAVAGIAAGNADARRKRATKEEREELKRLKDERKAAWAAVKARKTEAYEDEAVKAALKGIDAEYHARHLAERKASGLYHGTYEVVDGAARKTRSAKMPPKFPRWTGDGKIGTQVQGGISDDELFSGDDSRIKIELLPKTSKKQHFIARIKIASIDRKPIYAAVHGTWHRPLPPGSRIKWAYLVRRRIAANDEWSLQLTISRAAGFDKTDRAADGIVAVNAGWRQTDAGLRVAYWIGSDGREGELVLPEDERRRWESPDNLRGVRDDALNGIRDTLMAWRDGDASPAWLAERVAYLEKRLAGRETPWQRDERDAYAALAADWGKRPGLPDWWAERAKNIGQWRGAGRFAALAIFWRDNRFDGDGAMLAALEAWRKQDKHLWEWEAHQRKKAARWRREIYRNFAATLRREYARCIIAETDHRKLARLPSAESNDPVLAAARYNQRMASPGELTAIIAQSGPVVEKAEAANLTQTCHACGHLEKFDAVRYLVHTCTACGAVWDQDANHCRNLLAAASGGVASESRRPLEPVGAA